MTEKVLQGLLIEDDLEYHDYIRELLSHARKLKTNLHGVRSFAEGLDYLEKNQIDFILLDLTLPDGEGVGLVDRLFLRYPYIPIHVITDAEHESLVVESMQHGAQDFLIKGEFNDLVLLRSIYYSYERKRMEKDLDLAHKKSIAQAKMAALGEMAGAIAHEINNPLAVVSARAEMLQKVIESEEIDREKALTQLEKLNKGVDRINKIVRGIRGFARASEADPFERASLKDIIGETLEMCRGRLKSHGVELRLNEPEEELSLSCRATQISQVLMNLINNADQAIEDKDDRWIEIEVKPLGNEVEMRVTDSGDGIPEEVRDRMMESFYTTKEKGKGTGLGLSIAKSIIDEHQGSLEINSDHPHTQFVIKLPKVG